MDFFTVPTLTFGVLHCFFVTGHDRRKILHFNVTRNPNALWVVQQLREAWAYKEPHRFLVLSCRGMKAYVLDTDVLVAAFRSDTGASRQVLEAARARRFDLLLSVPLMLEYESVLTRPESASSCESAASQYRVGLIRFASGRVLVFQGGVFGCSSRMKGKPSSPVLRGLGASNGAWPLGSNGAVGFTGITSAYPVTRAYSRESPMTCCERTGNQLLVR